jgi:hypothetical protein
MAGVFMEDLNRLMSRNLLFLHVLLRLWIVLRFFWNRSYDFFSRKTIYVQ